MYVCKLSEKGILFMFKISAYNPVNFRGHGETAGSIGNKNVPKECPTCGQVSLHSQPKEDVFIKNTNNQ